jgi:ATP-binding cassette subfamily C protein CydD
MNIDKRLFRQIRSMPGALGLTALFGWLGGILVILQARTLTTIVAGAFLQHLSREVLRPVFITLLVVMIFRGLALFLAEYWAGWLAIEAKQRIRKQFIEHISALGPAFTQNQQSAELVNQAINGIEALDAYFAQYIPQLFLAALIPISILVVVFPADWLSGLVLLLTAPLVPIFMILLGKGSEIITRRQWTAMNRLSNYFLDSIQGLRELKQLGRSSDRARRVDEAAEQYRKVTMQVLRITFLSAFVLEFLSTISTAVIAVEIGLRLLYGQMHFYQAFFILLLAPEFYQPLRMLGQRFHAGMNGITAAKDIYRVLEIPVADQAAAQTVSLYADWAGQEIRFENVRFTYPARELPAVDGVSFSLRPGTATALVGDSGAGKSTIAQLLMRFFPPDSGVIWIGNVPLSAIKTDEWYRWITWVPQQPFIFHDSLRANLLLGKADATPAEIEAAIQAARLDQVIAGLPQGLDTNLSEGGARLSGGQIQRLALARAFLANTPIVVLDEPTAHLDAGLEKDLEEAVRRLCQLRTVLVIAHRMNTVVSADQILVMQAGKMIERGNHVSLMQQSGVYRALTAAYLDGVQ